MLRILLIFLAGGTGCLLRYAIAGWAQRLGTGSFPVGTLTVNVIGCMLLGFLAALFTGPIVVREEYRLAIIVGLLGGFTTFSTYAADTLSLTQARFHLAALNLLLSNAMGLLAAWSGARLANALFNS